MLHVVPISDSDFSASNQLYPPLDITKRKLKTKQELDQLVVMPSYSSSDNYQYIDREKRTKHKNKPKEKESEAIKTVKSKNVQAKSSSGTPTPSAEALIFWSSEQPPLQVPKTYPNSLVNKTMNRAKSFNQEKEARSAHSIVNKESSPAQLALSVLKKSTTSVTSKVSKKLAKNCKGDKVHSAEKKNDKRNKSPDAKREPLGQSSMKTSVDLKHRKKHCNEKKDRLKKGQSKGKHLKKPKLQKSSHTLDAVSSLPEDLVVMPNKKRNKKVQVSQVRHIAHEYEEYSDVGFKRSHHRESLKATAIQPVSFASSTVQCVLSDINLVQHNPKNELNESTEVKNNLKSIEAVLCSMQKVISGLSLQVNELTASLNTATALKDEYERSQPDVASTAKGDVKFRNSPDIAYANGVTDCNTLTVQSRLSQNHLSASAKNRQVVSPAANGEKVQCSHDCSQQEFQDTLAKSDSDSKCEEQSVAKVKRTGNELSYILPNSLDSKKILSNKPAEEPMVVSGGFKDWKPDSYDHTQDCDGPYDELVMGLDALLSGSPYGYDIGEMESHSGSVSSSESAFKLKIAEITDSQANALMEERKKVESARDLSDNSNISRPSVEDSSNDFYSEGPVLLPLKIPKKKQTFKTRLAKVFRMNRKEASNGTVVANPDTSDMDIDSLFEKLPPPKRQYPPQKTASNSVQKSGWQATISSSASSMPQYQAPDPPITFRPTRIIN